MELGGWYPSPLYLPGSSFRLGVPAVAEPVIAGLRGQEEQSGEQPVGSWDLGLLLMLLGKKPLLSRVRFDYSSLAVSSPLTVGPLEAGTF